MIRKCLAALAVPAVLAGCAIHQRVEPVAKIELKQICVVENPRVRATFLAAYQRALEGMGFVVQVLPENAALSACPLVSNYLARWQWDLALYMAYAEFKVFHDGNQVGGAFYNAQSSGANPSKFINAEQKVKELVDQMFPERGS